VPVDNTILKSLPEEPGIYKFYNADGQIIYVGKAKSIRKRVNSYFTSKKGKDRKTLRLVRQIDRIEFSVVLRESDALLLENNLIKEHQPKYNVLLKDGKTYPYIVITKERFPRIHHTRKKYPGYGEYFGPYPSVRVQKEVVDLLQKLFKFRTCKYNLSEENIAKGKFKICLEYHIGNCFGPCEGLYSEDDYNADIQMARNVLKGKIRTVKRHFEDKIQKLAENLEFEKAQNMKERLHYLERYHSKSLVSNIADIDIHVFTILHGIKKTFGNYIYLHEGTVIQTRNVELKNPLELEDSDLLKEFIRLIGYETEQDIRKIITNVETDSELGTSIDVIHPQAGDKKKILDLSIKNAVEFKSSIEQVDIPDPNLRKLETLKEELNLDIEVPVIFFRRPAIFKANHRGDGITSLKI
jgi:excinuclease ABC subunit C